jgi:hypothetical protein
MGQGSAWEVVDGYVVAEFTIADKASAGLTTEIFDLVNTNGSKAIFAVKAGTDAATAVTAVKGVADEAALNALKDSSAFAAGDVVHVMMKL